MQSAPLARRTAQGVVVDERLARVVCRWSDLASRDGERVDVEWTAQAGCVDTPADRQMLAERLLGANDATLDVAAIARLLADDVRPTLARLVATNDALALLDGSRDAELTAAIESAARRAGFAAGLRVAGPFAIGVDSPSVLRARDAERARTQLDALSADRATRSAGRDALADALARGDDAGRARAVRDARDVDPLDVLRAVAAADARWSSPTPALWLAVGDRVIAVDPTSPDLSREPIVVNGVGPIRSVRSIRPDVEGFDAVAVGGREGVAVVSVRGIDGDPGRVLRTFPIVGGDDFGFNAVVCHRAASTVIATHRSLGLASWRFGGPPRDADRFDLGPAGGRAVVGVTDTIAIALGGDGRLYRLAADGVPTPIAVGTAPVVDLAALGDGRLAIADVERYVSILDADGTSIARTRVASSVVGVAGLDLCGLPRVLVAQEDGSVTLVDVATGTTTPIGGGRWATKAIRVRPGFAVLLGVDRMRVALLDLARPDAPPIELHVHAALGRRVADVCFA